MSNSLDLYNDLLEKLEGLARRILNILAGKPPSVQDLWQFEIDLAKFQLEQQWTINAEREFREQVNARLKKVCRAKEAGWEVQRQQLQNELQQNKVRVSIYSHAYDIARKLGDTLAWIFLDRMHIMARKRDSSMPSADTHRVPEGHGFQGMLAIAEVLYNAGAGFPILHDITSCLRVGDITFYAPNCDPLTIEVKTRLKGHQGDRMILGVEFYCVSTPAEDARWDTVTARIPQEVVVSHDITVDNHTLQQPPAMEEGLQRQLDRMARVTAWQAAQDGKPFQFGERAIGIVRHLTSEQNMHYYDILQELIRDAKSQGFAWRTVDDAFVYTALYNETPLWLLENAQFIPEHRMEDYQRANISIAFPEPEANKNFAGVYDVFDNPPFVWTFFLYPLPADTIIDMMWRRLHIIVTVNLGKLVAALQSIGLDARLPKNKQEFDELFLPVSADIPLPDGTRSYAVFKGLQCYGAQMIHEFLSLRGFIKLVSSTAELTIEQVRKGEVYDNILKSAQ